MRISRPIATVLCGIAALALYAATIEAQTRRPAGRTSGRVAAPRRTAPARLVAPSRARTVYFRGYGYRPYLYGYYDPYLYGHYPYPYPYYGAGYASGSVRLQVKPEQTEVYVDGYPAGVVDSYDGLFQRLRLPPGEHEIVLYLDGYESVRERLYLIAGEAYKIDYEMVPLAEGIPQPPRPEPPEPVEPQVPSAYQRVAEEPPAERLFAADQFGTLAVRVQPADAQVLIDDELWQGFEGYDRLVVEIGAGVHDVEVRRDGYRTYRTEVDVREGDTTMLNVSLPRINGGGR